MEKNKMAEGKIIKIGKMKKCLREQRGEGKNKLDSKQFCRQKLGFQLKKKFS